MKRMQWVMRLLFPPKCILCKRILRDEETDLCHVCYADAPWYPHGMLETASAGKTGLHFLDSFTAVWYYEGNVRGSILRYKFRNARKYAPAYGRYLAMKLRNSGCDGYDFLTWVPVSDRRRRKRGYDQAEILAKAAGEEMEMPAVPLLKKIADNPPQSRMPADRRKANVLGVYACTSDRSLKDKRILLIDDILTTGATADECARMLVIAGAKEIHCAVLATPQKKKPSR